MIALPGSTEAAHEPRWQPLLLWCGCLLVAITGLQWLAVDLPAVPAVTSLSAWSTWASRTEPLTAVVAVLRLLALVLAWYLLGVTSVSVLARLLRATRLTQLADVLAVGPVRTLVQQALGVSLAAGVVAATVPTGVSAPNAPAVVAMVPLETAPPAAPATAPRGLALRDPIPAPIPAPMPAPIAPPPGPDTPVEVVAGPTTIEAPAAREHTVAPGDHFWSIAADEVAAHLGRAGTDREVRGHWRRLVEANADRLVARHNPDLLLPGQRLLLPAVDL